MRLLIRFKCLSCVLVSASLCTFEAGHRMITMPVYECQNKRNYDKVRYCRLFPIQETRLWEAHVYGHATSFSSWKCIVKVFKTEREKTISGISRAMKMPCMHLTRMFASKPENCHASSLGSAVTWSCLGIFKYTTGTYISTLMWSAKTHKLAIESKTHSARRNKVIEQWH